VAFSYNLTTPVSHLTLGTSGSSTQTELTFKQIRKGISGGQKRRVSVASQLVTGPKLLFLDEPTSGLDSAASFEVISFVKAVAKRNNVSMPSHYSIWETTDHLLVDRHY
jgi:ABC-type multidrug transport system ATPase subunit